MLDTYISFYLKAYRIHVFVDSLRAIGSPRRICLLISDDGNRLMVKPYLKKDLKSHSVPDKVYGGDGGLEISSYKLCRLIADIHHWDFKRSYRVPGFVLEHNEAAIYNLAKAVIIERSGKPDNNRSKPRGSR